MTRRKPKIIEKCYLIHFQRPLHRARHYLGTTKDISQRMYVHEFRPDARLMMAVKRNGIEWELVRTWLGGRKLEMELKRQKNSPRFCPLCRAQNKSRPRK